ncbi:hypothetical protein CSUI_010229, partial [Cystoisospora suis]
GGGAGGLKSESTPGVCTPGEGEGKKKHYRSSLSSSCLLLKPEHPPRLYSSSSFSSCLSRPLRNSYTSDLSSLSSSSFRRDSFPPFSQSSLGHPVSSSSAHLSLSHPRLIQEDILRQPDSRGPPGESSSSFSSTFLHPSAPLARRPNVSSSGSSTSTLNESTILPPFMIQAFLHTPSRLSSSHTTGSMSTATQPPYSRNLSSSFESIPHTYTSPYHTIYQANDISSSSSLYTPNNEGHINRRESLPPSHLTPPSLHASSSATFTQVFNRNSRPSSRSGGGRCTYTTANRSHSASPYLVNFSASSSSSLLAPVASSERIMQPSQHAVGGLEMKALEVACNALENEKDRRTERLEMQQSQSNALKEILRHPLHNHDSIASREEKRTRREEKEKEEGERDSPSHHSQNLTSTSSHTNPSVRQGLQSSLSNSSRPLVNCMRPRHQGSTEAGERSEGRPAGNPPSSSCSSLTS